MSVVTFEKTISGTDKFAAIICFSYNIKMQCFQQRAQSDNDLFSFKIIIFDLINSACE